MFKIVQGGSKVVQDSSKWFKVVQGNLNIVQKWFNVVQNGSIDLAECFEQPLNTTGYKQPLNTEGFEQLLNAESLRTTFERRRH